MPRGSVTISFAQEVKLVSPLASGNDASASPSQGQPDTAEVKAQLERILASRCFEQATRSSDFLKFVVEQTLAGNGQRLKGYTIAIEVFGRPETFDAQSDPLVRVEAGRLRRRLMEYYVAEGHADRVRIDLPRGGYAPEFRYARLTDTTDTAEIPMPQHKSTRRRQLRSAVALVIVVALLLTVVIQSRRQSELQSDPEAASAVDIPAGPRVLVLPFENLTDDRSLDYFAQGVTEEIMLRLSDLRVAVIASRASRYDRTDAAPLADEHVPSVGYVLTGSVKHTKDRVRISARLVHAASGAQLWTDAYDEDLKVERLVAIQERIAREVADTIAVPYGPIFRQELARTAHKPPEQLETYDCVLKYYAYRRTADPAAHRDTLDCFQQAIEREPNFADAWAGLALLYLDEYAFGYNPQPAETFALDRAGEAARTALDIDGDSLLGNLALARVRFFGGDLKGFEHSTDRLLVLGPENQEALALVGTLWAIAGSPERALPLIDKASHVSPPPPLHYVGHTVLALRDGRADDALAWALKIDAPSWFIAPLLVAASAGLAGRQDVATRAMARLLELYPTFPEHARQELAKWRPNPKLLSALEHGLEAAGLDMA